MDVKTRNYGSPNSSSPFSATKQKIHQKTSNNKLHHKYSSSKDSPDRETSNLISTDEDETENITNSTKSRRPHPYGFIFPISPHSPASTSDHNDSNYDVDYLSASLADSSITPNTSRHSGKQYDSCCLHHENNSNNTKVIVENEIGHSYLFVIITIVAVILIISAVYFIALHLIDKPTLEASVPANKKEIFFHHIQSLRNKFTAQNNNTWKIIQAATKKQFIDPITQPAVIMFVTYINNSVTSSCIVDTVAKVINNLLKARSRTCKVLDLRAYEVFDENQQSGIMETFFRDSYSEGSRCFLIKDLQLLKPESAKILHGIADHESSPYKDSYLLMTYHIKDTHDEILSEKTLLQAMLQIWSKLGEEEVYALSARVSNNVAFLVEETKGVLNKQCFA